MYKLRETLKEKDQHLRCINYSGNYDKALARLLKMEKSYHFEREVTEPKVVLVCEGLLVLTLDGISQYYIPSGKMFFLPPGIHMSVTVAEEATVIILTLDLAEQHCARLGFSQLAAYKQDIREPFTPLPIRSCVRIFVCGMMPFLEDGLLCSHYLRAKTTEFVHIFKTYYGRQEQAAFFYPLLGEDMIFSNFVSKHIRHVKSVEELAFLANMSRSGFIDKFRRKMRESPAVYIRKKRLELIKADLLDTSLSLKEISLRYGYEHYEVFSRFCKKNLGVSPAAFRQRAK